VLKKLLILLLLVTATIHGMDQRLYKYPDAKNDYVKASKDKDQDSAFQLALFYEMELNDSDKAIKWYKKAYEYGSSSGAYNLGNIYYNAKQFKKAIKWYIKADEKNDKKASHAIGVMYEEIYKNNQKAIKWYKKAYEIGNSNSAINLGSLYDKQYKDYQKATEWYQKAYEMGDMSGANSLGYLYDIVLKDIDKGIYWYTKGAKGGNAKAINNLNKVYHEKGDKTKASAYAFAMINYGYTKKQVLDFLKNERKIDRKTLEKAYKLQQTLDIPKHYTGGID